MTPKDLIIQEQRAEIKRLTSELITAKAMLHRMSKYVPDEKLAEIVISMTPQPKKEEADEEFWRGE